MKKLAAINFLNSFIVAAITIIVPLILIERGIDVTTIGLILSLLPLVFMLARLVFAPIADQIGFKPFFIIQWLAQMVSILFYLLASSVPFFLLGRVAEGIRDASYWSVNRTAIFQHHKNNEGIGAAKFSSIRRIGYALGMFAAGLGLAYFSYQSFLIGLTFLCFLMGAAALRMKEKNNRKLDLNSIKEMLRLSNKDPIFWEACIAMFFAGILWVTVTFALPVYMRSELNLGYELIGTAFAFYYLFASFSTYIAIRFRVSLLKLTILQILFFSSVLLAMPFLNHIFLLLLMLLSIGDGLSLVVFEAAVAKVTKDKISVSTDISYLHAPSRIAEFLSYSLFGFIIQNFGYLAVFLISSFSFLAFALVSYRILKKTTK